MGSPFEPLTQELPSVVVDRVHATLLANGDADFLAFFADAGTPGGKIKIILRPDPAYEPGVDPLPSLFLWGLSQGTNFEVGGYRFAFGVGYRFIYPEAPRYRAAGEADAGSLWWKFLRALLANPTLLTGAGADPKAQKIDSVRAVTFQGLEYPGNVCVDLIEGEVVYQKLVDKDEV